MFKLIMVLGEKLIHFHPQGNANPSVIFFGVTGGPGLDPSWHCPSSRVKPG